MAADRAIAAVIVLGGAASVAPVIGSTTARGRCSRAVLVRWHSLGGRLVVTLAVGHAIAATALWPRSTVALLGLPGLAAASAGTGLLVMVGVAAARTARKRLPHETWHLLHLLTYVAVALCFTHQLAGPDLAGRRPLQVAWSLLYTYASATVLRYRVIEPARTALRHRLIVENVVRESADVVSIVVSGRHLHELEARPGQFFRWRFLSAHTWRSARPFSLSAAPDEHRMRVTVKALGPGSRRLLAVQPGVRVLAGGPHERVSRPTGRPTLFVAGGVGITPIRALFETIAAPSITLLYRASTPDDVLFRLELDAIAQLRNARVVYLIGPSADPANAITSGTLADHVPGLAEHDVYVCASPRLTDAVRIALDGAGVPRRRVHVEHLSM